MIIINSNKINYDEIIKNIAFSLRENFNTLINRANFDKTFKAKVIGNINGNKYQILYKGQKHTVTSETVLTTNQIVRVCAPQNNWSELFVIIANNSSSGGDTPSGAYVSGVKGDSEGSFRTGNVNITKTNIGLGNVENKSSETIRSEITSSNVTTALGYTPLNPSDTTYQDVVNKRHEHDNKNILDTITQTLINNWNSAVTHITDTIKHITNVERTNWNEAYNKRHEHSNKNILDEIVQDDLDKLDSIEEGANKIIVDNALSSTSENPVQNKVVLAALNEKAESNHKHNYAGSDSPGGVANSANKLETPRTINGVEFDGTKNIEIEAGEEIIQVTTAEYEQMLKDGTLDETKYYLTTDDETNNLIVNVSGLFTLALDGWNLVAYYNDSDDVPPISFDPDTWNLYYDLPDENTETSRSENTEIDTDNTEEVI